MPSVETLVTFGIGLAAGIVLLVVGGWTLRRALKLSPTKMRVDLIAEQVRTVGKLIGLEVFAKEIATATKGFSWMPPLLLSQARVAMIFHFEKQYGVDLTRLSRDDVQEVAEGLFRVKMPPIEGSLRLIDVTPYDIQDGRVLGLLDIIQVNASTQKELMNKAQEQAARLFEASDPKYRGEAKRSVTRQITTLLSFVGAKVEVVWEDEADKPEPAAVGK